MSKIEMARINGKYADQRMKFLEEHAPDMLEAMVNDGSIYEHLCFTQELVSEYVDGFVNKTKQSMAYKKAESECDLAEMNRIIATAQTVAEAEAGTEWIYMLPDADEKEESTSDKSFDDMSYDEAVQDIYNDISGIKTDLYSEENETEE